MKTEAFVTLATTDVYALSALVLGHSLRRTGTQHPLVVMVTDAVPALLRTQLSSVFDSVVPIAPLDSGDTENLSLLGRPELGATYCKIALWRLHQYSKCVFLDADTLVLQPVDELFEREELSAAPDVGWPDCFNSGVFVFRPNEQTFKNLLMFALNNRSFDGGDQGLLNAFFADWAFSDIRRHLPFIYNCVYTSFYTYRPAFAKFAGQVKIVHYAGPVKPWNLGWNERAGELEGMPAGEQVGFYALWWATFLELVQPSLGRALQSSGGASNAGVSDLIARVGTLPVSDAQRESWKFERIRGRMLDQVHKMLPPAPQYFPPPQTPSQAIYVGPDTANANGATQESWQRGQVDYRGAASFENIQRRIDETMNKTVNKK